VSEVEQHRATGRFCEYPDRRNALMKMIATLMAGALALGSVATTAAEARPRGQAYGRAHHAQPHGYRRHRGNAGAAAVVGIAGALIGGAAIAAASRHRRDRYYDAEPAYGYGPPPGYYDDGYGY
jgi:hypothetical protein